MTESQTCREALPGSLLECICSHLDSNSLAACSAVCKAWHVLLCGAGNSGAPWAAALRREYGHTLQSADDRAAARRMLIAARTSTRLFLAGNDPFGLPAGTLRGGRSTTPEELALLPTGAGSSGAAADDSDASARGLAGSSRVAAGALLQRGRALGGAISIRSIAAGADFAVLLTWDGRVLDTRCQMAAPTHGRDALEWRGFFQPPCCRAVAVAAGGRWQCSGRPGGYVLVVTDQHTVWGWGANTAGQLGLGSRSSRGSRSASGTGAHVAEEGPGGGVGPPPAVPAWVAAPLEVVECDLAAGLGLPHAAACGEEHTLLACRDGSVHATGSNAAGACGLPLPQLASSSFSPVPLPAGEAAAAVACGGRNSAVVTARGRLLVCGGNELGQAGVGKPGGAVFLLRDIGPCASWHGMQRSNQSDGGGGGEAAAAAAGVTVGCGSLYAWTDGGDAFAWGQGGQGELALGASARNVATPSRMPWAHGTAQLAASCSGRFAALVDISGRLFTFGAGKSGALGHGNTAKRAVGRQVKALAGYAVHAVACGSDWMLVAAGWRPASGRGGRSGASPRAGSAHPQGRAIGSTPCSPPFLATPSSGFAYKEVEPEPASPCSPRLRSGQSGQQAGHEPSGGSASSTGHKPGSTPGTPSVSSHTGDTGTASEARGSSRGSRLRGRSGREQLREWEAEDRASAGAGRGGQRGCRRRHGDDAGGFAELPDAAPEAALARRRRWMREPPAAPSPITPPDVDSGPDTDAPRGRRRGGGMPGGVDREMAYLMRRQLKAFSADPRQRVLVLPKSFSSRDRWKAHVMAESWGLMHESRGEGGRRRLVVWKPSRGCKTLKPSMLEGWSSSSNSDLEGDAAGEEDQASGSSIGAAQSLEAAGLDACSTAS
ncbi:hypothetical protein ABPG77_008383 [Micractinium sp. CCAP 211/92]